MMEKLDWLIWILITIFLMYGLYVMRKLVDKIYNSENGQNVQNNSSVREVQIENSLIDIPLQGITRLRDSNISCSICLEDFQEQSE